MKSDFQILAENQNGTVIGFGHIFYITRKPWDRKRLTGPMIECEKRTAADAIQYFNENK